MCACKLFNFVSALLIVLYGDAAGRTYSECKNIYFVKTSVSSKKYLVYYTICIQQYNQSRNYNMSYIWSSFVNAISEVYNNTRNTKAQLISSNKLIPYKVPGIFVYTYNTMGYGMVKSTHSVKFEKPGVCKRSLFSIQDDARDKNGCGR